MKKVLLTLILASIFFAGFAQQFEVPKEGAKIYLSSNDVNVNSEDEIKLDVWVVRSKRAKKSKFDTPKFLGSNELTTKITSDQSNPDHYIATLKLSNVPNGTYFYTVTSRSRSIQKVTGTTLTITVEKAAVASNNND